MTATGWPFLIARGRRRGYSVLLAPPFLRGEYGMLEEVVGGPAPGVQVVTARGLCVVWEEYEVTAADIGANPHDEHSRPLRLLFGYVSRETVRPSEADMENARSVALEVYRRFLADEERFALELSAPFATRSAAAVAVAVAQRLPPLKPRRWLVLPVAAAGVVLTVVLVIATSGPEPAPPLPTCPTATATATTSTSAFCP